MSDSENESRTAVVGRKRIRTSEQGNYAIAAPASSAASGSDSETSSKESGEISSSESGQQNIPANSDDDQGSESDDDSSETDSSSETDDSDEEVPAHSMASPQGSAGQPHNKPKDRRDEILRLSALTDQEEDDQLFYFHRHLYSEKHPPDFISANARTAARTMRMLLTPALKAANVDAVDNEDMILRNLWCTGPKIVVDPHSEHSDDSPSHESHENDGQNDPLEGLEDFANDRPTKKRDVGIAEGSDDEGEVKEDTPPPARSNW
ncbi:hypothetical protein PRZ48_004308 [Zasmidium cellare]|uniref:Uncharacterized protein n=1 Tax=Zasmidium cellare TaxID=395010 RepID=A0ABR0ERD5_ZASCE|nr:hypothetical protein PRZ48_004308 [Zasmidium cellare]